MSDANDWLNGLLFLQTWHEMQADVYTTAISKGRHNQDRTNGEAIAMMHCELSEAVHALRAKEQDKHLPQYLGVEVELADCVLRIMDFAAERGLRVGEALVEKARYNKTREYKHEETF